MVIKVQIEDRDTDWMDSGSGVWVLLATSYIPVMTHSVLKASTMLIVCSVRKLRHFCWYVDVNLLVNGGISVDALTYFSWYTKEFLLEHSSISVGKWSYFCWCIEVFLPVHDMNRLVNYSISIGILTYFILANWNVFDGTLS